VKEIRQLDVQCPEWDILSCIIATLSKFPHLKLQYVKGHQDRTAAYERLPLLAQLNVDADDMATKYQCKYGASRPFVLLTQLAGVHLVSLKGKGTHTSKYATAIRHQATVPIQDY
jgi:hypothetical protein